MKKLLSILMVCAMFLSLGTVVMAEDAAVTAPTEDLVLFDFSESTNVAAPMVYTTERANEGKAGSGKVSVVNTNQTGVLVPGVTDWKDYTSLKITMASKYAYEAKMNVQIEFADAANGQYAIKQSVPLSEKDFTDIIIPLSQFTPMREYVCNWSQVKDIIIYFDNWSISDSEVDSAAEYYFDKIALTMDDGKEDNTLPYEDITLENGYVINELGSDLTGACAKCTLDNEITRFGYPTTKWSTSANGDYIKKDNLSVDISSYSVLYLELYSHKATSDDILVRINESPYKKVVVDWTGWKTVAVPMSTFGNPATLTSFQMWDRGWDVTFGANNCVLNIGRIWIGNSDTNIAYENVEGLTVASGGTQLLPLLENKDYSSYDTVNFLISNDKNNNADVGIQTVPSASGSSYVIRRVFMDFEGTKVVSIPVSVLNLTSATTQFTIYTGWSWEDGVNAATQGNTVKLHKIWYSKDGETKYLTDTEKDAEWVTWATDLSGSSAITVDLYSPANNPAYVTALVLQEKQYNEAGEGSYKNIYTIPLVMDFEGWKTFTINLEDYPLNNPGEANIIISDKWGIGGYNCPHGNNGAYATAEVMLKNFTKNRAYGIVYTTADKTANELYFVFDEAVHYVTDVAVTVVDKETNSTVETDLLWCGNKLSVEFDKENRKSYDVTLKWSNANAFTGTFTADVTETEPEVTESSFVLSDGALSVTEEAATVKYNYQNGSGSAKTALLVIAIYKADGTLDEIYTTNYKNLLSGRKGELEAEKIGNYTENTVKAFVWSDASGLTPLTGILDSTK